MREIQLLTFVMLIWANAVSQTTIKIDPYKPVLEIDTNLVVTAADVMPKYPGGDSALLYFVASNVEYPAIAKENGISGISYISYVVDIDGSIKNIKVAKRGDPFLDQAATEVVSRISGYTPGQQDGKPVPVQFTVPIRFVLNYDNGNYAVYGNSFYGGTKIVNLDAKQEYEIGMSEFNKGQFINAVDAFTKSITLESLNYVPFYYRAIARYNLEQYESAEKDFAEVLRLTYNRHLNTFLARGEMRYDNGQYSHAMDDFKQALELDKKNYDAHLGKGRCHSIVSEYSEALSYFKSAMRISAKSVEPHVYSGTIFLTQKEYDKAIKSYSKALKIDPSMGQTYYNRGMSFARKKEMSSACEDWIKAKELGVKDAELLVESQCSHE